MKILDRNANVLERTPSGFSRAWTGMRSSIVGLAVVAAVASGSVLVDVQRQNQWVEQTHLSIQDRQDERLVQALASGSAASGFFDIGTLISQVLNTLLNESLAGFAESIVGATEKWRASVKEIAQSELNYQAAAMAQQSAAEAAAKYAGAKPLVCNASLVNEQQGAAGVDSSIESKSIVAAKINKIDSMSSSSAHAKEMKDIHDKLYCSEESVARGYCEKESVMPDADLSVASLLQPEQEGTMTDAERDAALAFIDKVHSSTAAENLPQAFEKTPQGQRFMLEKKAYMAHMSAANATFARIIASRRPREGNALK